MLSGSKRQRDSGPAPVQIQERYTLATEDLSRSVENSTAYEAIRAAVAPYPLTLPIPPNRPEIFF